MRDFRLLWLASTISSLGTWLLVIAVPVHVYASTGSVMATSLVLAVESLPALLIGPWAGAISDRLERRTVFIGASLGAALGISLMFTGAIYLGLLAESVAAVFIYPASRALLPAITGTGTALVKANSLMSVTSSALRMGGPVLGTLTYLQGGLTLVLAIDVASYVLAALIVLGIRTRSRSADGRPDVVSGLRYLRQSPLLRTLLASSCAFWTANAALTALLVPFLVRHVGADGSALGYVITALGLGYLTGSAVSRWLLELPPLPVLAAAFTAAGMCFLVMFGASTLPVALAGAFLLGVPGAVITTVVPHAVQVSTTDSLLGRTIAAFGASDAFAALAGAVLAAALSAWLPVQTLVLAFSLAALCTGPLTLLRSRTVPGLRLR